jgi:hypothetical protein
MSKAAELAALIGSQTALSNRNLIINGAMQVAQRGHIRQQRFEGQNLQRLMSTSTSTKAFTLSFYAKQNETRNIVVEIRTSQGTNRQICKLFAVTSSWARYEFTVPAQASDHRRPA